MIVTRLNLGCGQRLLDGYANLDIKFGHCLYPLADTYDVDDVEIQLDPQGLEEIRASHILEHFPALQTQDILADWVGRLRAGGSLRVAVPDFGKIAHAYVRGDSLPVRAWLMGSDTDEHDIHRSLFDKNLLTHLLASVGLIEIQPWLSPIQDCASLAISLNLRGVKSR